MIRAEVIIFNDRNSDLPEDEAREWKKKYE